MRSSAAGLLSPHVYRHLKHLIFGLHFGQLGFSQGCLGLGDLGPSLGYLEFGYENPNIFVEYRARFGSATSWVTNLFSAYGASRAKRKPWWPKESMQAVGR
jgi:hypothetical protein